MRGEEQLTLEASVWAEILLLASKSGWHPNRPTYYFLARNFEVQADEAASLASVIQHIWDTMSEDDNFNPKVAIDKLMSVGAFCLKGPFITH